MNWIQIIARLFCGHKAEMDFLNRKLADLKELIPKIEPVGTIDISLASSILLDKLEEMGDTETEIYLPDNDIKVYNKEEVKRFLSVDETSELKFVAEVQNCDDFAATLFGMFAGLLWTNVHALCFFIDEQETLWFIEPQTDRLSQALENWQGWHVRFFVGR